MRPLHWPGLDPAQVRTVIPDADAAAAAWSQRTGVYPINHVVVVKDALLAEHPWLADELMRLFNASKRLAGRQPCRTASPPTALPSSC